jgi:hypothetical protein
MAISGSKDLIVFPNDNSGRFSIKEVQYTANGTFTVPTGVTAIEVIAVGGGGGGGGGNDVSAGGGGGGGQVVQRQVNVTPGTTYNIAIGAGGHGGQGAVISAADNVNTQPGGNGGSTTFGGSAPVNLLMNPSFSKGVSLWEANNLQQIQKNATGTGSTFTIIVAPDNTGIVLGQVVSGTGIGTNAIVSAISGTTITLSVANSTTVSGTLTFRLQACTITPTSIVYNDNIAISPSFGATQSNNVIQSQYAQLEDLTLNGGSFFVLDTLGGISAAVLSNPYTKLPEMVSPAEISGSTTGANSLSCVNSTAGARLVGLSTSVAGALNNNGTTGFAYDPNATYTVSAYVYHTNSTPQNLIMQLRVGDGSNYPGNNQGTANGTGTVYSAVTPSAGGYHVAQQTVSAPLSGYGGSISKTISGSQGNTFLVVDNADGLFVGQVAAGTGVATNATITSVSGTTINLSLANTGAVSGTGTFTHSGIFNGAWRRVSATFTGLPAYAAGLTAKWAYVGFLIPANTTMQIDNVQIEVGASATAWRPPTYEYGMGLKMISTTADSQNMEASHDWVKAVPGTQYTGSVYAWAWKEYRAASAYLEFYDADQNIISTRTVGSPLFLPTTNLKMGSIGNLNATPGKRLQVTATAPGTAAYVRFGVQMVNAANNNTGGAEPEFYLLNAQLEVGSAPTYYKDGNSAGFTWAGESHYSTTMTAPLTAAKGGGGGGTYNSNLRFWQFGLPGANAGGHAATNSATAPTYAGGGAGAGSAGFNAISYSAVESASGTTTGFASTGSTMLQNMQQLGNLGGYATTSSNVNIPTYGGDGGYGINIDGSGTLTSTHVGGGGGGGGWNTFAQGGFNNPGRGNAGGGKGGHTYLAYLTNPGGGLITDVYARGLDAAPGTGGGGGGAGSNGSNSPLTLTTHSASQFINFEGNSQTDMFRWTPVYNCTTLVTASAANYGTYGLRATAQDAGNMKVITSWTDFPIMPRTQLFFSGFAFRLNASASNPGTPNIGTKVARPTIIWLDINKNVIREDRPTVSVTLVANAWTSATVTNMQTWQPPLAPQNAAYFQVAAEMLAMSGGDFVDIDFNTTQYYPYYATGGNGGDGTVILRYTEKFTA